MGCCPWGRKVRHDLVTDKNNKEKAWNGLDGKIIGAFLAARYKSMSSPFSQSFIQEVVCNVTISSLNFSQLKS